MESFKQFILEGSYHPNFPNAEHRDHPIPLKTWKRLHAGYYKFETQFGLTGSIDRDQTDRRWRIEFDSDERFAFDPSGTMRDIKEILTTLYKLDNDPYLYA